MSEAGESRRRKEGTASVRKGGRHAHARVTVVRLTEPAFTDLVSLNKTNPPALRWALKKLLLLEQNPEAGEPLRGALIGFRKLTVSNRTWRVVWRVTHDDTGTVIVDVAEVWAVGARSNDEVYAEMTRRVTEMPQSPITLALSEVVDRLGRSAAGIAPASEPVDVQLPQWLVDNLIHQAGMRSDQVQDLTLRQAVDLWTAWMSAPQA